MFKFFRQKVQRIRGKMIELLSPERSLQDLAHCNTVVFEDSKTAASAAASLEGYLRKKPETATARVIIIKRSLYLPKSGRLSALTGYIVDETDIVADSDYSDRLKDTADRFEFELAGHIGRDGNFKQNEYRRKRAPYVHKED